jgi:hypothetical protein
MHSTRPWWSRCEPEVAAKPGAFHEVLSGAYSPNHPLGAGQGFDEHAGLNLSAQPAVPSGGRPGGCG